jgi:predicted anti-sigma-YlaC factor YlaD
MPADSHPHSPTPEEIMAYLDGETPPASRAIIETHLAGCKECEMVADSLRRVSQRAAEWTVEPSPTSMRMPEGPLARPQRARVLAWRPSRFVLAGLTAAAAVLLVISLNEGPRARSRAAVARAQDSAYALTGAALPTAPADRRAGHGGSGGGVTGGVPQVPGRAATLMAEGTAPPRTPSVIRTARLQIVARDFAGVRSAVESVVTQSAGFIDEMTITGDTSTARVLRGTLRVPGDRLADALARLRQLGQVVEDTQGSEDVTDQIVDLGARLASAHATEQRLTELLRHRTGKLSDVLEVERELARVRLDIERLDAEKTNVGRRVSYATIGVTITEERKAGLDPGPLSLATRIRIAAADGLESALETVALTVLFLLRAGPSLVLWGAAGVSIWLVLRRRTRFGIRDSR